MSGSGKITADSLEPWSSVSVLNTFTGDALAFPASEVPSGVLNREPDGRETLLTVDGLRLELDGHGNATVHEGTSEVPGPGIFMVVEILPESWTRSIWARQRSQVTADGGSSATPSACRRQGMIV
ncbi:hypothetical protein [Actinomadura kijaniata]|uniref:hypothetical protein n=1 Tax=Actinomadura kijaniata TaxID=46161 RepID=UPI00082A055B|nr:hypothetical protein [Actinomadura kijaniata]